MNQSLAMDRTVAVLESLGIHAVFGVIMVFGLSVSSKTIKPEFPTIQAVVVDTSAIVEAREQKRQEELNAQREAAAERRRQQEAERKREVEQQRREQEAIEQRRQAEEAARIRQQREQERLKQLEQQKEDLRRQRQEIENQRIQQEREYQQAQDRRRQQDLDRQRQLELERMQQLAALENQERQSAQELTLQQEWVAVIAAIVRQNWRKPPTAKKGERCQVRVNQLPGGDVINASLVAGCNVDEVTKRSIVDAVLRSEPLPYKGYEKVFRRQLTFEFLVD
ncbi:MAG: cell envelope integrity protein TolA [Xanthomonadales bacterium]|nr:cell envelope integrity protein TolA [Xanthomonadales bacterium]